MVLSTSLDYSKSYLGKESTSAPPEIQTVFKSEDGIRY